MISVIFPVYNEEGNVEELYRLNKEVLENKMAVATRCGEFLLQNGFRGGLFRFCFYFKNYLAHNF